MDNEERGTRASASARSSAASCERFGRMGNQPAGLKRVLEHRDSFSSLRRAFDRGAAASFVRVLVREAEMRIWTPGVGFAEDLLQHAANLSVRGARIFDLQIALIATAHGAREIWTHDLNFVRVPGIRVRDPL